MLASFLSCLTSLQAQLPVVHEAQLTAPAPVADDAFGRGAALRGDTALVGAQGSSIGGSEAGAVFVYRSINGAWTHEATLIDPTPHVSPYYSFYGFSCALGEDEAFIGSSSDLNSSSGLQRGSVHVYTRSGTTWSYSALVEPSDAAVVCNFGRAVDLEGDRLVIGAPSTLDPAYADQGAYVYERQGGQWVEITKLTPSDVSAGAHFFGESIALDGDRVLVGDPSRSPVGYQQVGGAYVYARTSGAWVEEGILEPVVPNHQLLAGWSVALRGEWALVGAPHWPGVGASARGAVYVYRRQGSTWSQVQVLLASDGQGHAQFGDYVQLGTDRAYVSAYGDDAGYGSYTGSLYAFRFDNGLWTEFGKALAPDPVSEAWFGRALAYSDGRLLVGATAFDSAGQVHSGKAYVLKVLGTYETYCAGSISSAGCVAATRGAGLPSASSSSGFSIQVESVEGQRVGAIFYGVSGAVQLPWTTNGSSGYLCVRPPTQRTGMQISGGTAGSCTGVVQLDWNAYRASHPAALGQPFGVGSVVNAQGWIRDPASPKSSILASALEFTLLP